jgi:hypothetical protein
MRVLAVGADRVTARKLRSGRMVTVLVSPKTHIEDGAGEDAELASLAEGDLIAVKGKKGREHGMLRAKRIKRMPPLAVAH